MIVSATSNSLVGFRGTLIRELLSAGNEVVCVAPPGDQAAESVLSEWGASFESISLDRSGANPFSDLWSIVRLQAVVARHRPDIVFSYNIKPMIYATLAAWLSGVKRRVVMIEGMGYAFSAGHEWRRRAMRMVASALYAVPCTLAQDLIVLNRDDETYFSRRLGSARRRHLHVIPGIGVDLEVFAPQPLPGGPITFVMICRLLRDKGVMTFLHAARELHRQGSAARFVLVGGTDANPASVGLAEVEPFVAEGVVDYVGEVKDVRPFLARSHVFVLPTMYREGLPRTVLEALAVGRPCITSDAPGCRDIIVDGVNGLLVKQGDTKSLVSAMARLEHEESLCERLASNVRSDRARLDAVDIARMTIDILMGNPLPARDAAPSGELNVLNASLT